MWCFRHLQTLIDSSLIGLAQNCIEPLKWPLEIEFWTQFVLINWITNVHLMKSVHTSKLPLETESPNVHLMWECTHVKITTWNWITKVHLMWECTHVTAFLSLLVPSVNWHFFERLLWGVNKGFCIQIWIFQRSSSVYENTFMFKGWGWGRK